MPDQLFGGSSASHTLRTELTQPDQLRLLQRVARAIEAAPQRGGFLRLRLRRPNWAPCGWRCRCSEGNLTARIETETAGGQRVAGTTPATARAAGRAGIQVEQFDVDVSSRDSSDTPFESHDADDALPPRRPRRRAAACRVGRGNHLASDLSVYSSPGKLNVVI